MSIVNTRDKTINTKIVYYGPGLGGKTTSLKYVHAILDPDERVKMVSLKTDEERTLFFDFLPIDLGQLGGYKVKMQGLTVPGQVKYNLTRKYVLMGADGVVFVADSARARLDENAQSFANLRENMLANGLDPELVPVVIQYNKRDLPDAASPADIHARLGAPQIPQFETDALRGTGVFDAFVEAAGLMLSSTARRYRLENGEDIAELTRRNLVALGAAAAQR